MKILLAWPLNSSCHWSKLWTSCISQHQWPSLCRLVCQGICIWTWVYVNCPSLKMILFHCPIQMKHGVHLVLWDWHDFLIFRANEEESIKVLEILSEIGCHAPLLYDCRDGKQNSILHIAVYRQFYKLLQYILRKSSICMVCYIYNKSYPILLWDIQKSKWQPWKSENCIISLMC